MAEFCLDCWNKRNKRGFTERGFILSHSLDLCEGCGQIKRVIVAERHFKLPYDLMAVCRKPRKP